MCMVIWMGGVLFFLVLEGICEKFDNRRETPESLSMTLRVVQNVPLLVVPISMWITIPGTLVEKAIGSFIGFVALSMVCAIAQMKRWPML